MSDSGAPILFISILLGLIPAFIARSRGRSFIIWWIVGALLPLIAIVISLFLKDKNKQQCNFCKEYIHRDAVVCPRCGNNPRGDPLQGVTGKTHSFSQTRKEARWPTTED
jgi:hypothetical protein